MTTITLKAVVNGEPKESTTDSWLDLRGWLNELHDLGFGKVSGVDISVSEEK